MPPLTLRPAARAEIEEAYGWYEERRPGLGEEFLAEVADPEATVVLACFHASRDPRRWHRRR